MKWIFSALSIGHVMQNSFYIVQLSAANVEWHLVMAVNALGNVIIARTPTEGSGPVRDLPEQKLSFRNLLHSSGVTQLVYFHSPGP